MMPINDHPQNFGAISNSSAGMLSPPLRWLHLSDFHVGKDNYGLRRLFKHILSEVRRKVESGKGPDLVFITGDIADKGREDQYKEFADQFLFPLAELVGEECAHQIIIVPGNHDVDRTQAQAVRTYDVLYNVPTFLDPTGEGASQRKYLFDRFKAYVDGDITEAGGRWLFSTEGALSRVVEIKGHKLGILGLNTAWLSRSNEDRHKLSAGKAIIETGLDTLHDCDVRLVLGHHPIDWFIDEDVEPVRSLFGKHNVIYLHGHLHKPHSRYEEGAGHTFLAIQAGVCFEARDEEIWVSRMLWGELDFKARRIQLEPLRWAEGSREWVIDGAAFPERYRRPGTDRWVLPLPTSLESERPAAAVRRASGAGLPYGWVLADKGFLDTQRAGLDRDQVLNFFDGRWPGWAEALAPQIPRRGIVYELAEELGRARTENRPQVTLMTGAGGEGKSTALMQVVGEIVENTSDCRIVWHGDTDSPLPSSLLKQLPEWEGRWLIASDDADLIAGSVFKFVQALNEQGRRDVQFLLCCRDTDWVGAGADQWQWYKHSHLIEKPLRGLSTEDAIDIVRAWSMYGRAGLGKLEGLSVNEAAARLVEASSAESDKDEGAFLGGMLRVRLGEDLKTHVKALMDRLQKRPAPGGTLLDAFSYIAAAHSENIKSLSKIILADVFGCGMAEITEEVVYPLGDEAAVIAAGQFILTRHRAIAEAAMGILRKSFRRDTDEIFVDLVQSVRRVRSNGGFVPKLGDWDYLSSHFFDQGNQSLGVRLAKVAVKTGETKEHLIVKYAQLLREAGQSDLSIQAFRDAPGYISRDRNFYGEWGTSEGVWGNHALSAWLQGVTLADGTTVRPPDNEDARLGLTRLSISFLELFDKFNLVPFIGACDAALQLISRLRLTDADISILRPIKSRRIESGVAQQEVEPATALKRLQSGIIAAWEHREEELSPQIQPATSLGFNGLARLLGVSR